MEIRIFDKHLNRLGTIDSFISLLWYRKFYEAGTFELHIRLNSKNIKLLEVGNLISPEGHQDAGIIEVVQKNDQGTIQTMVVNGRFLTSILDRRIIKKRILHDDTVEKGMRKLIDRMRPFSILDVAAINNYDEQVRFQCTYKNVYDFHIKLAKASNISFTIEPNFKNKRYVYRNFKGVDHSYYQSKNSRVVFSKDRENLKNFSETISINDYKNYVLVGGVGEGENRILVEHSNFDSEIDDLEIREIFVDAKGESKSDDMPLSEYTALLDQKALDQLTTSILLINLTGEVVSSGYLDKWDLGDKVSLIYDDFNTKQDILITEVQELHESGKKTITPTFGSPIPELFENDEEG